MNMQKQVPDSLSGVCLGLLLATFLYALVAAWPVMITLGTLHSQWNVIPPFGFLATMVILWALDLVGRALFRG